MPKVGDKEFAYTEQGMADAKAESAETGIPISDGATRNVTEYAGGGKTGYNAIGNPMYGHGGMTGMDKYKKGGKVMDIPGEQVKFASEKIKPKVLVKNLKKKEVSKEQVELLHGMEKVILLIELMIRKKLKENLIKA